MNYTQALEYIHSIPKFMRPLGNANLGRLLASLGEPEKKLKYIHIAGTNGKGSVAAMTAEILIKAGYKTGLYTSPFIEIFNERIAINGRIISDEELTEYTARVKKAAEKSGAGVSEFAFVTAMAFLYFCDNECDAVVLETGLGGKLDATNIIPSPAVTVITSIGMDHMKYLGNTIGEIAAEKCGIIKSGSRVVSEDNSAVRSIIEATCTEKDVPLVFACPTEYTGSGFVYKGKEYPLALRGEFQAENAAAVLECVNALNETGFNISEENIRQGLADVRWAARFEYIRDNVIIDGAHNENGMKALVRSLASLKRKIYLVFAMMSDKDADECVRIIAPTATEVFITEIDYDRCMKAEKLQEIFKKHGVKSQCDKNIKSALEKAMAAAGNDGTVCICGSLYLAGAVRALLK